MHTISPLRPRWVRRKIWNRICKGLLLHRVSQLRHLRAPHINFAREYGIAPAKTCFCTQSRNDATVLLHKVASHGSMESHLQSAVSAQSYLYATVVLPMVGSQENMEPHLQGLVSDHSFTITPPSCPPTWLRPARSHPPALPARNVWFFLVANQLPISCQSSCQSSCYWFFSSCQLV